MTSILKLCLSFLVHLVAPRGEEKARLRYFLAMGLLAIMVQTVSCSPSANKAIDPDSIPDTDTSISDGGTYNPTGTGTADPCAKDAEGNDLYPNCQAESTSSTDPFLLTTQSINYGVNELGAIECSSISIPNGITFSAELDHNASSAIDLASGTCSEAATAATFAHEFVFQTAGGTYSEDRQTGASGTLTICYVHGCLGTHSAQVKLVAGGDGSAAYAHVISLSGQTSQPYFTVNAPTEMQIIHPVVDSSIGRDDVEGDYTVDVAGLTNKSIDSIFQSVTNPVNSAVTDFYSDGSTPIIISAAGVKKGANYDASSGAFSLSDFPLPQTADIYTLTFSRETNKGYTISKDVDVVVPDKPEIEIVLMDTSGAQVTSSTPTDLQNLVVGFKVSNLQLSGPTSNMKVTLSEMTFNGEPVNPDAPTQEIYYGQETPLCYDAASERDYAGFDGKTTLCASLGNIIQFQSSYNTLHMKACNALTVNDGDCREYDFYLIVDNKRPVISITSPHENELCYKGATDPTKCQADVDNQTLTISGTVKNYKPVDDPETAAVETAGSTYGADASDVGTYCIPTEEADAKCPESGVRLWVNVPNTTMNQDSTPIYVYPVASGETSVDGRFNQGNCTETETTESLQDGGAGVTEIVDGQVVTTITETADDGTVTTTVITTAIDGTVTKTTTVDGEATDTSLVTIEDDSESYNADVVMDTDGTITSTEVAQSDDAVVTTATTTDPESGEVTQTVNTKLCNVPEGSFTLHLNLKNLYKDSTNGEALKSKLNYYTNVVEVQGESVSGHRAIGARSFQYGLESRANFVKAEGKRVKGDLTAGQLGSVAEDCVTSDCVTRAPIMVNLAAGLLEGTEATDIKSVVQYALNKIDPDTGLKTFSFAAVAHGFIGNTDIYKNADGSIDVEKDFKEQYNDYRNAHPEENLEEYGYFLNLPNAWQQKFIQQALHSSSMAMKVWALTMYRQYRLENDKNPEDADKIFFKREGDSTKEFDVAQDACGSVLTSALLPLKDYQHIVDDSIRDLIPVAPDWPAIAGTDLDFDNFVEGKWIVDSVDLKEDGYIDADICLVPEHAIAVGCDDHEIDSDGDGVMDDQDKDGYTEPALWGSVINRNLVDGGITGLEIKLLGMEGTVIDDPIIPLIWSVGKLRLRFNDAIRISKSDINGVIANRLNIDPNKIKFENIDQMSEEDTNDIILEPFKGCADYYRNLYPEYSSDDELPTGCNVKDYPTIFPVLMDVNSKYGQEVRNLLNDEGKEPYLLTIIDNELTRTVKNLLSCMDTELVNPMLGASDYPVWTPESLKTNINQTMFVTDELEITDDETADNLLANAMIDIIHSDLQIDQNGILVRLPFTLGVNDVSDPTSSSSFTFGNLGSLNLSSVSTLPKVGPIVKSSTAGWTEANTDGHIVRSQSALKHAGNYPYLPANAQEDVFASASLNLEEVANSVLYLLFKKGPMELLDVLDVEGLEKTNNFQVGFDKVVMANMDNCGELVPGLVSEISPGILFPDVKNLFEASILHLDIILDKDNPPTFYMDTVDDTNADGDLLAAGLNMTHLKLGVTNLQIGVKNLFSYGDGSYTYEYDTSDCADGDVFEECRKANPEVLRLRADGVIDLKLWYNEATREMKIYIGSLTEQNLHLSVTNPGLSYDDLNIVSTIYGFFSTLSGSSSFNINQPFTKTVGEDGTVTYSEPTITVSLGNVSDPSLVNLMDNIEIDNNIVPPATVSCETSGIVPPEYYDADGTPPPVVKISKNKFVKQPLGGILTNPANVAHAKSGQDRASKISPKITDVVIQPGDIAPGIVEGSGSHITDDPCWMYSLDDDREDEVGNSLDNPLQDALCDFGIKDLTFPEGTTGPRLDFDNDNGYIHLSVELAVEVFSWVNEVSK